MMIHKVGLVMMAVLLLGAGATAAVHLNQDATATAREAPGRASPTTDPARAAPGRMFVVGRVLDPQGRPVPGASVMAYAGIKQPGPDRRFEGRQPSPIGRAASDGSGRFRLDAERTSSARHQLVGAVATAPGLGAGWVELDPDLDRPASEIVLRPEQIIEGRLFDLVGRPVAGVRVEVHAMGRVVPARLGGLIEETTEGPDLPWSHGQDRPGWPAPATSDAEGRFTIRGLGRGVRVRLGIDDPRFARLATRIDTDDAPGPKSLKIALEPARTIVGRVTDAGTGRPIPRARILVLSRKGGGSGGYINEFRADDEGRFRLNPLPGDSYSVSVDPPPGRPNLSDDREFAWPKGSVEHRIDFALPRGEPIRGKVVEEGSGRGIGGAWVGFRGRRTVGSIGNTETAPDGSFQLAAKPTPGYLIVLGPSDEYVYREIGNRLLDDGQPGGRRFYAHAFVAHDVKPGTGSPEVTISLRRGGTVRGLVVGPDGRPIPSAAMIGRTILNSSFSPYRYWMYNHAGRVRDGRFEVHGLDPDAEVPVHFFEPKGQLGATAMLSGKSGNDGPVTVRLGPCGTARARLVDRDGRPVAGYRGARLIAIIVTPGAVQSRPGPPPEPLADSAGFAAIDPAHYGDDLVSDADGRIALPDLIPGASYRVIARDRDRRVTFQKDFTLKPGEAIDLGDIVVERP